VKWQINVHLLQSRIYRRQGNVEEALLAADVAVDKAQSPACKTILSLVDAYLARGEALLSRGDSTGEDNDFLTARDSFEKALQSMLSRNSTVGKPDYFSNPKIASVCSLRIAECYVRLGRQMHAKKHYAVWSSLEQHVEHEWVRELAASVKRQIENLAMDFTISATDRDKWNYSDNVASLRRWLLTHALRQTNHNYSEAAKLLGVQRATLYQWQTVGLPGTQRRVRGS
jgi:DNA-binding protein Fis